MFDLKKKRESKVALKQKNKKKHLESHIQKHFIGIK